MVGATGVEGGLAMWAGTVAAQVTGDAEGAMTAPAIDGFGLEFSFGPDLGGVAGGFVVALDASVKLAAALMLDGNNVALGVVVSALGTLVHVGAVNGN